MTFFSPCFSQLLQTAAAYWRHLFIVTARKDVLFKLFLSFIDQEVVSVTMWYILILELYHGALSLNGVSLPLLSVVFTKPPELIKEKNKQKKNKNGFYGCF